ncbi:MAG: polysaccharide biosynthesis protein [Bacteroidota bacterium]|nr:polysaccharide biosynthesis protein [Bacteroidota bacterium]
MYGNYNLKNLRRISFDSDIKKNNKKLGLSIQGSRALIIGGAGTIGSNYIKNILKYKPSKLVIVDYNENGLTELTRDLRSSKLLDYNPNYITYPVNLNSEIFDKIFLSDKFDIVANFSAHKHVRSEKDKISIEALIKNNVFGTIKLLNLSKKNPPKFFFSVSTDKAANPVNIMGASKSLMEKLIISQKFKYHVSTARFANVAFSNGSLLNGFEYRIQKKQPLSCPIDIKRFFVTPYQSGQICMLATFLGKTGNIFFPKFDFVKDQIYLKDIALDFLKEKNFEPVLVHSEKEAKEFDFDKNPAKYPIHFFKTDTSGEKTYEEFFTENEDYEINKYDSLGFINTQNIKISFKDVIYQFDNVFNNPYSVKSDIVDVIKKYVLDFVHHETGKNLDQKM